MRNKKRVMLVLMSIVVISLALVLKAGSEYYTERYVASGEYYLKVPENIEQKIEDLYDSDGNAVEKGKSYHFKAMDIDGNIKDVSFDILTKDPNKLLEAGTYLRVEASETINLSEETISKEDVPKEIVEALDTLN